MGIPIITPGTGTRDQAITDIIESVALEQTALSNILNAEGTKLQTVIAAAGVTPTQLLETNQSVEDMTNAVSRLEMILQLKLDMFSDCICNLGNKTNGNCENNFDEWTQEIPSGATDGPGDNNIAKQEFDSNIEDKFCGWSF